MEYQKIISFLDNIPNQPTKFRTKNRVEINDDAHVTYNTNSQIKFNTSMLKSSLCDNSDAYILVSGTITVTELAAGGGNNCIEIVFKICAPFTDCKGEINNAQIDNAKNIDVVIPMYILIEYNDNYSKTSGSLWQYYRDKTTLNNSGALANFLGSCASFKFKQTITGETGDDGRKDVKIMVLLKYLSNFWTTLEMPSINCEINLMLTWSGNCDRSNAVENKATTFALTDTELYVPVVTLSTDDNRKLLQQLKSLFKRKLTGIIIRQEQQHRMLQTNI